MARAKKTLRLRELVGRVNCRNRLSTCPRERREGWNQILEEVLHAQDAYAGFGYLDATQVPDGQLPGIVRNQADPGGPHAFPDDTRRFYYQHKEI